MVIYTYCDDSRFFSIRTGLETVTNNMKYNHLCYEGRENLEYPYLDASHLSCTNNENLVSLLDIHHLDQMDQQRLNSYDQQPNYPLYRNSELYFHELQNSSKLQMGDASYSNMTVNQMCSVGHYKHGSSPQFEYKSSEHIPLKKEYTSLGYEPQVAQESASFDKPGSNESAISSVDTVLDPFGLSLDQKASSLFSADKLHEQENIGNNSKSEGLISHDEEGTINFTYDKPHKEIKPDNSVPWYHAIRSIENGNSTSVDRCVKGLQNSQFTAEPLTHTSCENKIEVNGDIAEPLTKMPSLASDEQWNNYWKQKTEEEQIYLAGVNYQAREVSVDGKIMRECSICQKKYSYRSDCDFHALDSHIKLNYACLNCGKSYSRRNVVKSHLRRCPAVIEHETSRLKRSSAAPYFDQNKLWNDYWSSKTMEAVRNLNNLGYSAMLRKDAEGRPVRICSLCSKEFKFKSRCDKHAVVSHACVKYRCLGCNKEYTRTNTLQAHVQTCPSMTRIGINYQPLAASRAAYPDYWLDRNSDSSPDQGAHTVTIPESPLVVSHSPFTNSIKNNVDCHPHNSENKETSRSRIKEEIAASLERLKYRCIAKKDGSDPNTRTSFVCSICMRPFSCRGECNRHAANVHTGVRYQCPKCHKTSSCPGSLRRHMESYHTQQNKHQCPHCPKLFSSVDSMRKHIKLRCKSKPSLE